MVSIPSILFFVVTVSATDTGWCSPIVYCDFYCEWTLPEEAVNSDDKYACTDTNGLKTDYGRFEVSIPSGATINGIVVSVEGWCENTGGVKVEVSNNGDTSWSTTGYSNTWVSEEAYKEYGGSSNLWGLSWTNETFDLLLFYVRIESVIDRDMMNIDHIRVKVYYTSGGGNTAPVNSNPNPSNANTGVSLSLANRYNHFNITVGDKNTNVMNISWRTNESGSWTTKSTNSSVSNGTYYSNVVSWVDEYSKKYWWSTNTSDGMGGWDNDTYYFTTVSASNNAPVITPSSQNPLNQAIRVGLSLTGNYSHFYVSITDKDEATQGINITWKTNESGSWTTIGYNDTSTCNATYYCNNVAWIDENNKKYWWRVNVTDEVGGWDNETYSFTTEGVWHFAVFNSNSGSSWTNRANAIDNTTATYAYTTTKNAYVWYNFTSPRSRVSQVHFYFAGSGANSYINVWIDNSTTGYVEITNESRTANTWFNLTFSTQNQTIDGIRVRSHSAGAITQFNLKEISIWYWSGTTANPAPVINPSGNELPDNESFIFDITPVPECKVYIQDTAGTITCTFFTSPDHVTWTNRQTNITSYNSWISYDYTGVTWNTTYYWKVSANDGTTNVSKWFKFTGNGYFPYSAVYFNGTDPYCYQQINGFGYGDGGTLNKHIQDDTAPLPGNSGGNMSHVEWYCGTFTNCQFNTSNFLEMGLNEDAAFKISNMYIHVWVWDDFDAHAYQGWSSEFRLRETWDGADLEHTHIDAHDKVCSLASPSLDPTLAWINLSKPQLWNTDESLLTYDSVSALNQSFTIHQHGTGGGVWYIGNRSINSFIIFNVDTQIWDGTDNTTDSDSDGLSDHIELNATWGSATNPFLADTDNDGISDHQEFHIDLTDPNNYSDWEISFDCEIVPTTWTIGTIALGTNVRSNYTFWQNGSATIDVEIGVSNTNFTFVNYTDYVANGYNQYSMNVTNNVWSTEVNIKIDPYNATYQTSMAPGSDTLGIRVWVPKSMSVTNKREDFEVILTVTEHT